MLERDAERVERALALYLHGRPVAEIAAELAISPSTVRRWAREALRALADDDRAERAAQLQRAIESQRAVASAAWEAYERERALDEALLRGDLDRVRRRAIRGSRRAKAPRQPTTALEPPDEDCPPLAEEEYERPKRSTQGPRYLELALAAQREVARLQGLYRKLEASGSNVRLTLTRRPNGPENVPPAAPAAGADDTDREPST
ncbi:MAG TPA: helix-turn-helix domain-containing protein [Ktedonobacterales bacterium]|nr:helix-turn-helix domain-containing protein [Ktedonobacterales bacterium]